ncbi:hypothetical protein FYJ35_02610 [Lachnospiraceae bacterium Oil+RF-744-WCA-WT-11]|uniref:Uncharacterized protein n=1 Tax=Porcincola intestinalis TaxID=2606632 RepID=A0A6L5X6E3_9FIRM|nr:hypothetical protein [Porcincola intestinalis]
MARNPQINLLLTEQEYKGKFTQLYLLYTLLSFRIQTVLIAGLGRGKIIKHKNKEMSPSVIRLEHFFAFCFLCAAGLYYEALNLS